MYIYLGLGLCMSVIVASIVDDVLSDFGKIGKIAVVAAVFIILCCMFGCR